MKSSKQANPFQFLEGEFAKLGSDVPKMLNFFTSKDVRKILKRKDSDAGEKGTVSLFYSDSMS